MTDREFGLIQYVMGHIDKNITKTRAAEVLDY